MAWTSAAGELLPHREAWKTDIQSKADLEAVNLPLGARRGERGGGGEQIVWRLKIRITRPLGAEAAIPKGAVHRCEFMAVAATTPRYAVNGQCSYLIAQQCRD